MAGEFICLSWDATPCGMTGVTLHGHTGLYPQRSSYTGMYPESSSDLTGKIAFAGVQGYLAQKRPHAPRTQQEIHS